MQLLSLLLGVLREPMEAAAQLDDHLRLLRAIPLHPAPLGVTGNHLGWVVRQLAAAADLISACGIDLDELPPHAHPTQL